MKVAASVGILFIALQQSSTCNQPSKPASGPPVSKSERPSYPVHRFEAVPGIGGQGIALDTVTGQWCRTWDWVPRDPKAPQDGLSTVPTCLSLFELMPSTNDPRGISSKPE